jgi:hypothetical protein
VTVLSISAALTGTFGSQGTFPGRATIQFEHLDPTDRRTAVPAHEKG